MTSEPLAPGAPAIILYHEVNRDDLGRNSHSGAVFSGAQSNRYEDDYYRIKILTEEGRKYANIEIPFFKGEDEVTNVMARTIRPDGSVVNFSGKVFEQTIEKKKGLKYVAKTLALPDVQVGCIIEYYFTISFKEGYIFFSQWILSNELFTKKAKFTLRPFHSDYGGFSFRWNEHLAPGIPSPVQGADDVVTLEANNIEAFRSEDFMPPENELKSRVDFIYSSESFEQDVPKFWKKVGKHRNDQMEAFINKRGAMEQVVSQIVAPGDSPEAKLRKIYARVQKLRNTTYEVRKTEQEEKREKKKTEENVEDIWKQGYGDQIQINWLCLALARAAGIEASGAWVSDRSNYFFDPKTMQSAKLDRSVVLAKLDGKDLFLEPGAAFTPFGLLPWDETGVPGLRLDKDGGSWVQTALPPSSASRIDRKGNFKLSADGTLEGNLEITFTGIEALRRRIDQRNEDATTHKKYLEDEVKSTIPLGADVELTKQPDWSDPEVPLTATFDVKIQGWASMAGRRALLQMALFGGGEKHVFDYSNRVHPIYFESLSQKTDDLTIAVPSGWQIGDLPKPQNHDLHAVAYTLSAENANGSLHLTRTLNVNVLSIDTKYYDPLRNFFQMVRTADEQQIVLQVGTSASGQ